MIVKLYNLINDENDMPKLNVINEVDYEEEDEIIRGYDTILLLCKLSNCHKLHTENVYMATYNHWGQLIGFFHIASGYMNKVSASDRIKATCILLSGGFSFEIYHNHPIDDINPSENDKISTYSERALATYLETEYLADYIVTKGGWTCVNTEEQHRFTEEEYAFIYGEEG